MKHSGRKYPLGALTEEDRKKNNKQMQTDACKCKYRKYWLEQRANFCGACGGSLRTAD